jgi:Ulp1 family protease
MYDCGFYSILYMEHFNGKVMPNFENDVVPDFRRLLAASLIDNRDNQSDDVDVIMNEDLQQG